MFGRLKLLVDKRQGLHFKCDHFIQGAHITEGKRVSVWKAGEETNENEIKAGT